MERIPVALSCDNRQAVAMSVVMVSAIKNAALDTFFEFYCLLSKDVSPENRMRLQECKNCGKNCSVSLIEMAESFQRIEYGKFVGLVHSVTAPALYRLKLPSILERYEKVIYLDTDTLVRCDLKSLFHFELGDAYFAGVPVAWAQVDKKKRERWLRKSKIPEMDDYLNSGVLLMNLKKMREETFESKCLSLVGNREFAKLDPADQLILNFVGYGKVRLLPCRFNVTMNHFKNPGKLEIFYSRKEIREALEEPAIIHWTGACKPWLYYDVPLAREWLDYFRKTPFAKTPLHRSSRPGMWKRFLLLVLKFFKG